MAGWQICIHNVACMKQSPRRAYVDVYNVLCLHAMGSNVCITHIARRWVSNIRVCITLSAFSLQVHSRLHRVMRIHDNLHLLCYVVCVFICIKGALSPVLVTLLVGR